MNSLELQDIELLKDVPVPTQAQPDMGSYATPNCEMDPARPRLSFLSSKTLWRHYLRQEPGALVAHAGICAGGAEQSAFLPRPSIPF